MIWPSWDAYQMGMNRYTGGSSFSWCETSALQIKASKTKEMDFKRKRLRYWTLTRTWVLT